MRRGAARTRLDSRVVRARSRVAAGLAVAATAAGPAGCGGEGSYENALRPPSPITVTAAIDDERVRVSPKTFGGGPVVFVISNQSAAAQRVTFETDELGGSQGGIRRSSRRLAPGTTGQLQVDAREGSYRLSVSAGDVEPAAVEVSERRPSAQDELLQP
jgi:hypothetical protein